MFTDPALKKEILRKKEFVQRKGNEDIYALMNGLFDSALEREALKHSIMIEHPAVNIIGDIVSKEEKEELIRLGIHLKNAWEYGRHYFTIPFTKEFLIELAYRIEPDVFQEKEYRKSGVRPKGASVTPPYAAKLPLSMGRFFKHMNELYAACRSNYGSEADKNCFDIGSWIHLNVARLHPFDDGNGRTARMLHNLHLRHLDTFPPIVIFEGERKDYYNRLDNAVLGYKDRDGELKPAYRREDISKGEREFYDYMASKLNMSLDRVIDKGS